MVRGCARLAVARATTRRIERWGQNYFLGPTINISIPISPRIAHLREGIRQAVWEAGAAEVCENVAE